MRRELLLLVLSIAWMPACGRLGFELLSTDQPAAPHTRPDSSLPAPQDASSPGPADAGGGEALDAGSSPRDAGDNVPGLDAAAPVEPSDAQASSDAMGSGQEDAGTTEPTLTPPAASNLVLWLDGADPSLMVLSGRVQSWRDSSPRGHDVTQPLADRQPLLAQAALGGRSVVRFDGQDDSLALVNDGAFDSADLTVLVLVSPRFTTHPGNNPSPFAIREGSNITRVSLHMDGNKNDMHSWTGVGGKAFASFQFVANSFYLLEFVWSAGAESHYVNGAFIDTDSHDITSGEQLRPVRIGAAEALVENWPGDIAELLVYDRALTAPERVSVETYVERKWGVDTSP